MQKSAKGYKKALPHKNGEERRGKDDDKVEGLILQG